MHIAAQTQHFTFDSTTEKWNTVKRKAQIIA